MLFVTGTRGVRTLLLISTVMAAGVVATGSFAMQSNKRSGALHVTKECSQYNGSVGSFCTITSSNLSAIKPGMRVVYLGAPTNGVLDTAIVLTSGHGPGAFGHVVLNLVTKQGTVSFSGGTGRFAKFQANAAVTVDSGGVWHWDGSYSFASSADDD